MAFLVSESLTFGGSICRVGDERACVAVRMIEAVTKAGTAHILRAAVRDVSAEAAGKAVPQAAVAGTSAVLLFIDESDEPQQVSVVFRRLLAALPTETSASGGEHCSTKQEFSKG